ncbi:hypothetical protein Y026_5566 [Burkholderia pseudomallei TSV28]|nr:hypothetical protein Y026_5566 [Burkholderia pseudomallei TSV28]
MSRAAPQRVAPLRPGGHLHTFVARCTAAGALPAAAALEKRSLRQESDGRRRLVSYAPRRRRGVAPSLAGQ